MRPDWVTKTVRRWEGRGDVRFLTFSCYRRLPLLGNPKIRDLFAGELARAVGGERGVHLLACVAMPEHVHLVVWNDPVPRHEVSWGTGSSGGGVDHDTSCRGTESHPITREGSVSRMLYGLKKSVAADVLRRWREIDAPILSRLTTKGGRTKFWQPGGGHDRNLRTAREVWEKIIYVHENPVERGLCRLERDWPWSSVHAHDGSPYVGPTIDSEV